MQDLLTTLVERIEEARLTNKNPCNSYATRENALKATAKMAQRVANHFSRDLRMNPETEVVPARFIVLHIESWGRWVGFIDMTEVLMRPSSTGGYLGVAEGFFSY